MKTFYLAAAGAALLAAGSLAHAQGTRAGSSSGTDTKQCWDVANKVVRDVSGTHATGPSGNRDTTVGSTTSQGSTGTSSNANAASRPAGLPDC